MDGDYSWIWIVVMVAIFLSMAKGGRLSRQQRKLNDRIERLQATPPAPPPCALPGAARDDVERLEQRVRVLERIVTDGGYTLASQIEALRDDRRPTPRREVSEVEEKT